MPDDDMRRVTPAERARDQKAVQAAEKRYGGRVKDNPQALAKARAIGGRKRKAKRSKKAR